MQRNIPTARQLLVLTALCLGIVSAQVPAQSPGPASKQQQTDDVIRVKTELAQTDVTVVDKRGRFVDGLQPEQFELRVDAKPRSLAFFEQVVTGSAEEEKQLTAARTRVAVPPAKPERSAGSESAEGGRFVKWNQSLPLPPGLYQVRVAVRDCQSGRTGSAMGWIEIPRAGPPRK